MSLGIAAAWRQQGHAVVPFKKGPDYIDSAWLARAAGSPCRNLDQFLMSRQAILGSLAASAANADVALIEGNRGLYDGVDGSGTYSSAELAKLLGTPVVLVVDCTKMTRTIAAIVRGCRELDTDVYLGGVILNRVAGARHERVLRDAIASVGDLPVLGVAPRLKDEIFPERHLGLVPPEEHGLLDQAIDRVADIAVEYLDLDGIMKLATEAPLLDPPAEGPPAADVGQVASEPAGSVRIAVLRDEAFQFYYPENLEALVREGAKLVEVSPIRDESLPEVDALYIGGGFPETLAPSLSANRSFMETVRRAAEGGLPVYAECGGAVFLGRKLRYGGKEFRMAGVLPAVFGFGARPQGHGYVELETTGENPFYEVGMALRGHEFHYTFLESTEGEDPDFAFTVRRGFGYDGRRDGMMIHNVLACYTHIHALGVGVWAPLLARAASRFRTRV